MKRVAAGAHLPSPWLFEPVKRPTIDLINAWTAVPARHQCEHQVLVFTVEWTGAKIIETRRHLVSTSYENSSSCQSLANFNSRSLSSSVADILPNRSAAYRSQTRASAYLLRARATDILPFEQAADILPFPATADILPFRATTDILPI